MTTAKERSQAHPEGALCDVVLPDEYVESRPKVFGSKESWRWFTRKHRDQLFAMGALLEVGGRTLVVATAFDRAVLELANAPRKTSKAAAA